MELIRRDPSDARPERLGGGKIEVLVQVEPHPKARLLDLEEMP
jgi:hypothetical protein